MSMNTPSGWQAPVAAGRQSHATNENERGTPTSAANMSVMRTGPSGLLLGPSAVGPVTIRLFRPKPTKVLLSVPDYVKWTITYRAMALGAHLTILTSQPRNWASLVEMIRASGGTVELTDQISQIPHLGRAYRPSLIVDDLAREDGLRLPLGAWQAVLLIHDVSSSSAMHALRTCDMTMISPCDTRATENLRRGYGFNSAQLRQLNNLAANEIVVAMPRRALRVTLPPTPTEYRLLFGGS